MPDNLVPPASLSDLEKLAANQKQSTNSHTHAAHTVPPSPHRCQSNSNNCSPTSPPTHTPTHPHLLVTMFDVEHTTQTNKHTLDRTPWRVQTGGELPCSPAPPSTSLRPTGTRCGGCAAHTHCHAERHAQQQRGRLHDAPGQPTVFYVCLVCVF